MHRYPEDLSGLGKLTRDLDVFTARLRISTWMVVCDENCSGTVFDGRPEYFTRVHKARIQGPARHLGKMAECVLRVQHKDNK